MPERVIKNDQIKVQFRNIPLDARFTIEGLWFPNPGGVIELLQVFTVLGRAISNQPAVNAKNLTVLARSRTECKL